MHGSNRARPRSQTGHQHNLKGQIFWVPKNKFWTSGVRVWCVWTLELCVLCVCDTWPRHSCLETKKRERTLNSFCHCTRGMDTWNCECAQAKSSGQWTDRVCVCVFWFCQINSNLIITYYQQQPPTHRYKSSYSRNSLTSQSFPHLVPSTRPCLSWFFYLF